MLNIPKTLYHGTFTHYMQNIMVNGLGNTTNKNYEESLSGVVYLTDDPYTAESYAECSEIVNASWVENDEIVVLEVDTNKLDLSKFKRDSNNKDETLYSLEYHGIIPSSELRLHEYVK